MPIAVRRYSCTALLLLALGAAACGKDTPTTPTATTTTQTAAEPTNSVDFNGTVPVTGSTFYSFSVSQYGTVNLTLTSVGGAVVPTTVTLGMGLGVPDGTDCVTSTTVNTRSGTTAQLTAIFNPGVYCAKVYDVGNLFGPASVSVTIAYP